MDFLRLPPKEYAALCLAVLHRDNWKCRSCNSRNSLSVHHIVFRSAGGDDTMENTLVLCLSCHNGIHVDVRDGVFGLVIVPNENERVNANLPVVFLRAPWWRPR